MDVLVIGASSIFQRRVLPALLSLDSVGKIHVASRRANAVGSIPDARRGRCFTDYEAPWAQLKPCLAYISLPNTLHLPWAERALNAGFHVVVDKPAFLNFHDAGRMAGLARKQGVCLAEASVWSYHPQVAAARQAFSSRGTEPSLIQAVFSFPPLPAENFRNHMDLGGGSFFDLGAYAVSPGRIVFGQQPNRVVCQILAHDGERHIDTAFSLTICYAQGKVFQGYFGFNTEYNNRMLLLGPDLSIVLEPAFTAGAQVALKPVMRSQNQLLVFEPQVGDSFAEFFGELIESIAQSQFSKWSAILMQDAEVLHQAGLVAGRV